MARTNLKPSTSLYPQPAVMVSCGDIDGQKNIITLAWAGVACSEPPMVSLGIRPQRFSYDLIKGSGEFVVNLPGTGLLRETDFCGNTSGRTVDKFAALGLTPSRSVKTKAPGIAECPVSLECRVRELIHLGSHDLFVGEVVNISADDQALGDSGKIDLTRISPLAYGGGDYWELGKKLGIYGFSKKKA
ncbi:MAG: flavin reductase family protein [Bacillota bacterium]